MLLPCFLVEFCVETRSVVELLELHDQYGILERVLACLTSLVSSR